MPVNKKTAKKCKTCAYALGYVKTLICPCPKCTGKTSIFENYPKIPIIIDAEDVKSGGKRNVKHL